MSSIGKLGKALGKFKRAILGTLPTPLHRLGGFEKSIGREDVWIKRDDLTGLAMGGNKVRSLEYFIGDAVDKGADTLVVGGPLQSNMCLITAAAARKAGIDCITVHNGLKPEKKTGNTVLLSLLNVDSRFIGEKTEQERNQYVAEAAQELKTKGKNPYVIEHGGSTALGCLGYVQAAMELYEQIIESELNIKHIFMPAGNGGAVSGLVAGAGLLDLPFHVHVVSVELPKNELDIVIPGLVADVEKILDLKIAHSLENVMTIHDAYMGEGWGVETEKSKAMVSEFPQREGIFVEDIYTSKVVVGMLDLAAKGTIPDKEGICYLHTGGLPLLFA